MLEPKLGKSLVVSVLLREEICLKLVTAVKTSLTLLLLHYPLAVVASSDFLCCEIKNALSELSPDTVLARIFNFTYR